MDWATVADPGGSRGADKRKWVANAGADELRKPFNFSVMGRNYPAPVILAMPPHDGKVSGDKSHHSVAASAAKNEDPMKTKFRMKSGSPAKSGRLVDGSRTGAGQRAGQVVDLGGHSPKWRKTK
jgi:hypothetical protein